MIGQVVVATGKSKALESRLFALAEAYPDLKASQNFMELQQSLADIEEQMREEHEKRFREVINFHNIDSDHAVR